MLKEEPLVFVQLVRSLLEEVNSSRIQPLRFYETIKHHIEEDEKYARPNVSGEALIELQTWVSKSLAINRNSVGELVSDFYHRYKVDFEEKYEILLDEDHKNVKFISRKNFPQALVYVLKVTKGAEHVKWLKGRNASLTGVELKPRISFWVKEKTDKKKVFLDLFSSLKSNFQPENKLQANPFMSQVTSPNALFFRKHKQQRHISENAILSWPAWT